DLIVLINEGEEFGLLGAEAFMKQHPLGKTVDVVINMEARGNQGKSILFETGEDNFRLIKLYQEYAKNPLSNSLASEIYKLLPNDTDLTVFKRNGISGVNFAFMGNVNHYHTPADNIQNLSQGSVQHQGDNVYAMLNALLSVDLQSMPEGNAVYTDVLSSFMIVWPEYMTFPLTFFALFLLILISWQLLKMKKLTVNQMTLTLPFAFGVIILSTISCWLLVNSVQFFSSQPQPWLTEPIPMRASILMLPFAVTLIFANKYKDKLGFWGLVLAGAYLLAVISIAASLNMPGLSYLTIIPLMLFTIMLSITIIGNQISNSIVVSGVLLISITAIAVLVFPIILLLEDVMGFAVAPVFGLLQSFIILFVFPIIVFADSILKKQVIYAALIFGLLGVFITSQQQAFNNTHPMALNFEYLQQGDKASIQVLTRHKLPQRVVAESEFSNENITIRPWSKATYPSIEAVSLGLPEPSIEVIASNQQKDEQQLTLRYSSERQIDQFLIYLKEPERIKSVRFDEQSFDVPSNQESQYLLCTGIACNGMVFTLSVNGNQPLEFELVDYSYGLPDMFGYLNRIRGETAQPIRIGDVAVVHKQFKFATKNK
ncbi:MAG: M28 family peptidase, partial [Gammaproteobacteria bacterium]|nr:M28 family peptidase [Gammaproteobacteria bacterium]